MRQGETKAEEMTLLGQVKNGVIVLDNQLKLAERLPVRIEPPVGDQQKQREDRYRRLLLRLQEWNEQDATENGRLSDVLQQELASDRGIRLRYDGELDKILIEP